MKRVAHWITGSVLFLLIFCLAAPVTLALDKDDDKPTSAGEELIPEIAYLPTIMVNNLQAELYSENHVLRVWGSFTNVSEIAMKGFITIYILDSKGALLYSVEIPVNNSQTFYNGQTVEFDETLNIQSTRDAAVVSVDFTKE